MDSFLSLPPHLAQTIGSSKWLLHHTEQLQSCFPEQWTRMADLDAASVAVQLRGLGVQAESDIDLTLALATLQAAGIMRLALGRGPFDLSDVHVVKRGPLVIVSAS